MFGSWVLDEIWIIGLSSALISMLMSSSKLFLFSNEAHLNCYWNCTVLKSSSMLPCLLICAKLTMAFTFTSLPLNFYTSVSGCDCGFGFEQKYWRIDGFGEKMAWIGRFAYPYSPLSISMYDFDWHWGSTWRLLTNKNYTTLYHTPPNFLDPLREWLFMTCLWKELLPVSFLKEIEFSV